MKVSLYTKSLSKGRSRLYLDFYPPIQNPENGESTRRHFLDLYLFDSPKDKLECEHNKETRKLAELIKARRQLEIQEGQYGFLRKKQEVVDFVQYFAALSEKRKESKGNYGNWLSVLKHIKEFSGGHIDIATIDSSYCEAFKNYLLTKKKGSNNGNLALSQNAALSYFNKFKAALKQAFKDKLINENLTERVSAIKLQETQREFLTLEELKALSRKDCSVPILKAAALFSCLTGLRWSDIEKLIWSEVQHDKANGYYVRFRQKKTKGIETLPISQEAAKLLGKPGNSNETVFKQLRYSKDISSILSAWTKSAGIKKKITFHCFRHTYATLQLSQGTDIYTVSKMLGHKDLKTTQVYLNILDKKKIEAAGKIRLK